jgi:hypothetical protein
MLESEGLSKINWNYLIDTVAKDKTAVKNADLCLIDWAENAVQIANGRG